MLGDDQTNISQKYHSGGVCVCVCVFQTFNIIIIII